jgi:hypothetical protein
MRFLKVRFISSNGLFILVILGLIVMMNFISVEKSKETPAIFFVFVFLVDLLIIGGILWALTAKVELSENGIEYRSLFKKVKIDWTRIESYGVYVAGSNVKSTLDKSNYDKFIWGGQKFIYLTEQKNFSPGMFRQRPQTEYIDFHFRKEAIEMIENKMKSMK